MKEVFETGGRKFAYSKTGDGPNRLLFIHGICGRGEVWARQAEAFGAAFEVISVDLFGHGDSSPIPGKELIQESTRAIRELVNRNPKPTTLIGHSIGGSIVNDLMGAGASFENFVFVDSPCLAKKENVERYTNYEKVIASHENPKELLRDWFTSFASDRTSAADRDLIVNDALDRAELVGTVMGNVQASTMRDVSSKRVLVIEGAQFFGTDDSMTWLQLYPDAKKWIYPKPGHFFFLDDPGPFNAALTEFLQKFTK